MRSGAAFLIVAILGRALCFRSPKRSFGNTTPARGMAHLRCFCPWRAPRSYCLCAGAGRGPIILHGGRRSANSVTMMGLSSLCTALTLSLSVLQELQVGARRQKLVLVDFASTQCPEQPSGCDAQVSRLGLHLLVLLYGLRIKNWGLQQILQILGSSAVSGAQVHSVGMSLQVNRVVSGQVHQQCARLTSVSTYFNHLLHHAVSSSGASSQPCAFSCSGATGKVVGIQVCV